MQPLKDDVRAIKADIKEIKADVADTKRLVQNQWTRQVNAYRQIHDRALLPLELKAPSDLPHVEHLQDVDKMSKPELETRLGELGVDIAAGDSEEFLRGLLKVALGATAVKVLGGV